MRAARSLEVCSDSACLLGLSCVGSSLPARGGEWNASCCDNTQTMLVYRVLVVARRFGSGR